MIAGGTGAGGGTGSGFLAGYGYVPRSAYATPLELGFKSWTLDFSPDGSSLPYPTDARLNPYLSTPHLRWQTADWDPALRFWALAFDVHLIEWLQDLDLSAPSVLAAREFASQATKWQFSAAGLLAPGRQWLLAPQLAWNPDPDGTLSAVALAQAVGPAWAEINRELDELVDLMEDERGRYLGEAFEQADGIPQFFMHLLAMDSASKPHTAELMRCGLAIGNLVYMHYKAYFRRVRPSFLCPGLVPPFGPPRHPAFPSGHAFLGHFIALLLLEIDKVAERYGSGMGLSGSTPGQKVSWGTFRTGGPLNGPLFWLAARLARNRERIGVHYRSDSAGGRQLAGGVWHAIFGTNPTIEVPTLKRVLAQAQAEWR